MAQKAMATAQGHSTALPEYMALHQVMEKTGLGRSTILRALASQELRGFKVGRRLLFSPEDVRVWIEAKAA